MKKHFRSFGLLFATLILLIAAITASALIAGAVPPEETADNPATAEIEPISADLSDIQAIAEAGGITPAAGADGVTPFISISYYVIKSNNDYVVIISGALSESTPLPAKIEFAVPKGSSVFWFGEVLGGDFADDISLPNTKRTEGDFDIYYATVGKSRNIWIEYTLPSNPFEEADGKGRIELAYAPLHDVPELLLGASFPPHAAVTASDLHFAGEGPNGEMSYSRNMGPASAGELVSTEITYTVTTGTAQAVTSNTVIIVIVVAIIVISVLAIILLQKRMKSNQR